MNGQRTWQTWKKGVYKPNTTYNEYTPIGNKNCGHKYCTWNGRKIFTEMLKGYTEMVVQLCCYNKYNEKIISRRKKMANNRHGEIGILYSQG